MSNVQGEPTRILVVAPPAVGRDVATALSAAGYETHRTPDAENAVATASRLRPQLAVVARVIPWSDGIAAAQRLLQADPPLPVLLLGGSPDDRRPEGAAQLPAGFCPAQLAAAVASLLAARAPRIGHGAA